MSNSFDLKDPINGIPVASPHSDGRWINEDVSRIVEIIRDYWPDIEVEWVPPDQRAFGDPAFRLMELRPDGQRFVMFYVNNESEFDQRVLERIFNSDQARKGNRFTLNKIDAQNDAIRAIQAKKSMEQIEEAGDLAASILRSPFHKFRHDGKVYGS